MHSKNSSASARLMAAASLTFITALAIGSGAAGAQNSERNESTIGIMDAYVLALESMPTIEEQRARSDAALARLDQVKGRRLPKIRADANYTGSEYETAQRQRDPVSGELITRNEMTDEESYRYGVNLIQPIYDRRISTAVDEADERKALALTQLEMTEQRLGSEVAEAYLRILQARDAVELAQAQTRAYQLRVEESEKRLERGLASRTDVLDARVRRDQARSEVTQAQNNLELARLDLEQMTGSRVSHLRGVDARQVALAKPPTLADAQQLQQASAQANPGVRVAMAELNVAGQTTRTRQAEYFPTLTAQARYSETDASDQVVQGEDRRIFLALEIPLYAGGQNSAGVEEAKARERAASARMAERRRQALIDTQRVINDLRSSYRRVNDLRQALSTAEEQLNAVERSFDVGMRNLIEVLDSRARLFEIRGDLSRATYDYFISQIQLDTLTGNFDPARLRAMDDQYLSVPVEISVTDSLLVNNN